MAQDGGGAMGQEDAMTLSKSELVAFIPTVKPEEAKAFYRDVLGLTLVADNWWALAFDAHGTKLRIEKVQELRPHPFTAAGWNVDDIRAVMDGLAKSGVRFERYDTLPQDDRGVWTAPSGARIAWFKDPDGNTLSLTQWP
jgi:catechol 2,3-dioxygenase-like lactoylglutathione lyase family enzyme